MLRTPLAIEECINQEFPDACVDVHEKERCLSVVLPKKLDLPNGGEVRISTAVSRQDLVESIKAVAQRRLFPPEASEGLASGSALEGWEEMRSIHAHREHRKQFELAHGPCAKAIVAYVKKPDDQSCLSTLLDLGLAPKEVLLQDKDALRCFREIDVSALGNTSRESLFHLFENVYRVLAELAYHQEVEKIKEAESRGSSSIADSLIQTLHRRVVGQDMAVKAMASELLKEKGKENRTFLFVGPTGVGKTELAEAVGELKGEKRFLKFDMANFQSESSSSAFSGASTGYLGSDDLPDFCKRIKSTGCAELVSRSCDEDRYLVKNLVILFDEIGKAHTTVRSVLLSLFDKGTFLSQYTIRATKRTASINKILKYEFENCIFIGTSNLLQELIMQATEQKKRIEEIVEDFTAASGRAASMNSVFRGSAAEIPFAPEVLGRMTVIPFGPIPKGVEGYQAIVEKKLASWLGKLNKLFRDLFPDNRRGVVIEEGNKQSLISLIESGLYGNGTNIRKVALFLERLQTNIVSTEGLKMTEKVELSIFAKDNAIYAQRFVVDEACSLHKEYGNAIKLHEFQIQGVAPTST